MCIQFQRAATRVSRCLALLCTALGLSGVGAVSASSFCHDYVTDPAVSAEFELNRVPFIGTSRAIRADGGFLYVANHNYTEGLSLTILQVEASTGLPTQIGSVLLGLGVGIGLDVQDGFAYVGAGIDDLHIVDVRNPSNPVSVGGLEHPLGSIGSLTVRGDYTYAIESDNQIWTIDVSFPMSTAVTDTIDLGVGTLWNLDIIGDYLWAYGRGGTIQIFDLVEPSSPAFVRSVTVGSDYIFSLVPISQGRMLASGGNEGIRVIDAVDPAHPRLISTQSNVPTPEGIAVAGDYAYGSDPDAGLHVFDISNPLDIQWVAWASLPSQPPPPYPVFGVAVLNQVAFAGTDYGILWAPTQCGATVPLMVEAFDVEAGRRSRIIRWSSRTAVAESEFRLHAQTRSESWVVPHSSEHGRWGSYVARDERRLGASDAAVHYSLMWLTSEDEWATVAERVFVAGDGEDEGQLRGARPNPFNATTLIRFDLARPGRITAAVYDAGGRLVRTLASREWYASGPHDLVWDGRNDAHVDVASGVYFVALVADGTREVSRIVLVK